MNTMPKARNYNAEPPGRQTGRGGGPPSVAEALRQIEAEGLSGRQLRLARRNAQKQGLEPASDIDAVRLMRARGLDPFAPTRVMDLVVSNSGREDNAPKPLAKPVRTAPVPADKTSEADARAGEIRRMQRDIARRRKLRMALLFARLAVFVLLPAAVAGYYYYRIATPLYATHSAFVIESASTAGGASAGPSLGGMLTGGGGGNDAINVQTYLQSRDAMLRLDAELGFKSAFSGPQIDPLLRLPPDATNEDAYALYKRLVIIGFDPTEGIVKMEVSAPEPGLAAGYARALIGFAEEMVDGLSERVRSDQMRGAMESYEAAEAAVVEAQDRILALQKRRGVVNAEAELTARMTRITNTEARLTEERLALRQMLENPEPNPARTDALRATIARLEVMIAEEREALTRPGDDDVSLIDVGAELKIAETDLQLRQQLRAQAFAQLEEARQEANRQARYLLTVEQPIATDEPAYPRAFENTVLALLILAGIYLMVSLTASILREQVAS
jgi:capsular polysaccharide transport system permease protein